MPFSKEVADALLVHAARCCCLCRQFKGSKLEIHHIEQKADGGDDTEENGIPLCFDCHAEVNAYNDRHPRGRKYTPSELRRHREEWFAAVASGSATRLLAFNPEVRRELAARLDERITEGEAILAAVQTVPGQWREKWVKLRHDDTHYRTPDRHIVDFQSFVQWTTRSAALVHELALLNPVLARQVEWFASLSCSKEHLEWGLATLRAVRKELEPAPSLLATPAPNISAGTAGIVAGGNVQVHGNVTVKTAMPPKEKAAVIPGTVSEDPRMIGYLRYLTERYHEFKRWECGQRGQKMNYAMIYVAYKRGLKYEMKHTPKEHFKRAVEFLQRRIERTVVGKLQVKSKQVVYSSFDDFDAQPAASQALQSPES